MNEIKEARELLEKIIKDCEVSWTRGLGMNPDIKHWADQALQLLSSPPWIAVEERLKDIIRSELYKQKPDWDIVTYLCKAAKLNDTSFLEKLNAKNKVALLKDYLLAPIPLLPASEDKPKCETCGGSRIIPNPKWEERNRKTIKPSYIFCPDCQPSQDAGEFVKEVEPYLPILKWVKEEWLAEKFNKALDHITCLLSEKKEVEKMITEVRPFADAYKRVCEQLGIKNNIMGYTETLKAALAQRDKAIALLERHLINHIDSASYTVIKNKVDIILGESEV